MICPRNRARVCGLAASRNMDPARMEKYWAEMEKTIKPLMESARQK
jgi:hypothetical protein